MEIRTAVALLILRSFTASAATIIAPVGPATNASTIFSAQFQSLGWTMLTGFTNVSIAGSLNDFDSGTTTTGTAFLMNQVGPAATLANQIASTAFTFVPAVSNTVNYVSLFSGLSLPASPYYLVLSSDIPGINSNVTVGATSYVTAPGVTVLTPQFTPAGSANTAFPPASTFTDSGLGNRFFTVTGDPVPEPATATLVLASESACS